MSDRSHSRIVTDYLARDREAGVPMEVHLYATGGHGFNMGQRSDYGWLTWR